MEGSFFFFCVGKKIQFQNPKWKAAQKSPCKSSYGMAVLYREMAWGIKCDETA